MPKFDWTQVSGYREDMTAEEKLALLAADDALPEPPPTVPKPMFDNVASELAKVKKQQREQMTAEEAAAAARAERDAAIEEELKALRRDKTISTHKASFLALGCDETLAAQAAEAMADGKTDAVFAALGQHISAVRRAAQTEALDRTPPPPAGDRDPGMTLEKLRSLSPAERYAFSQQNPEQYKTLYGGT